MKSKLILFASLSVLGLVLVASLNPLRTTAAIQAQQAKPNRDPVPLARMSEKISVQSAGRGGPWINLSDGRELVTSYAGAERGVQALKHNQARGLSLASDDFDKDGVADLVCGYANPSGGGIVALHRGNVDAIFPYSLEARQRKARGEFTDAPFLSPARVFELPEEAEFLDTGDFDADGNWDVVAASSSDDALYLMRGDGNLGLAAAERINLPGRVTAMVVGEINRSDGLVDLVVAVSDSHGAKVLVFEGPNGALRREAEEFDLPVEASSLALGQLDESYEYDLAIAAGSELLIVRGRDRKLSHDEESCAAVEPAKISRKEFAQAISAIAVGEFVSGGDYRPEVAVLLEDGRVQYMGRAAAKKRRGEVGLAIKREEDSWEARAEISVPELVWQGYSQTGRKLINVKVSIHATDDLLVIDRSRNQVQVVSGGPGSRSSMHEAIGLEADGEAAAILPMRLSVDALNSLVMLKRGQAGPSVITPAAAMTFTVTNTNEFGAGSFSQAIKDANNNPGKDKIFFNIPGLGPHTILAVTPLDNITEAVDILGDTQLGFFAGKPIIELRGIRSGNGLRITGGNTVVRGLVINRFAIGIVCAPGAGGNVIEENYIGTDVTGKADRGNTGHGVFIFGSNKNMVGGNQGLREILSQAMRTAACSLMAMRTRCRATTLALMSKAKLLWGIKKMG